MLARRWTLLLGLVSLTLCGPAQGQPSGAQPPLDSGADSAPAPASRLVVVLPIARTQWSVTSGNGTTSVSFTAARWRAAFRGVAGDGVKFLHASNTLTTRSVGGQVTLNLSEAARASGLFAALQTCLATLMSPLGDVLRQREPFAPGAPFVVLTVAAPPSQAFLVPRRTTTPILTVQIGTPQDWQVSCSNTLPAELSE